MKQIILISFAFISVNSFAGAWTDNGTIIGLKVDLRDSSPRILVSHDPDDGQFIAQANCRSDKNFYQLKYTADLSSEAYAMIVAAWAGKVPIRLYIDGCGADWPMILLVDTSSEG
jgi:hypothetical protein